jgi:hypothetical protein
LLLVLLHRLLLLLLALVVSVAQALVLPARKQREANRTMVTRVLVVVAKTVHVLVPTSTLANTTCKRLEPAFSLTLHLAKLLLVHTEALK